MKGLDTPNLAYPVHRCVGRGGKYYAHYGFLRDGLHPSVLLLTKWSEQIIGFCTRRFEGIQHVQQRVINGW